jgi:multidrug efflux pump subunit AcrB
LNIARPAIEKRVVTGFTTMILLAAGALAYFSLGQLEDPEFTIKTASVITAYPGATAAEVELEVTDRIEIALQELPQIDFVESISRPGLSIVKLELLASYGSDQLPQIWDEVRKKVRDARASLPPGAGTPVVGDDFADL